VEGGRWENVGTLDGLNGMVGMCEEARLVLRPKVPGGAGGSFWGVREDKRKRKEAVGEKGGQLHTGKRC